MVYWLGDSELRDRLYPFRGAGIRMYWMLDHQEMRGMIMEADEGYDNGGR